MTASRNRIWIDRRTVGGSRRTGEIVEVLGEPGRVRYRVRWEDGRETIVYPGGDATLPEAARRRRAVAPPPPETPPSGEAGPEARPVRAISTAAPGDRLVIRSHHLGEPQRDAKILEVLGDDGGPPYRVRWQDTGVETLFFPGSDAFVEHFVESPRRTRRRAAGRRSG